MEEKPTIKEKGNRE